MNDPFSHQKRASAWIAWPTPWDGDVDEDPQSTQTPSPTKNPPGDKPENPVKEEEWMIWYVEQIAFQPIHITTKSMYEYESRLSSYSGGGIDRDILAHKILVMGPFSSKKEATEAICDELTNFRILRYGMVADYRGNMHKITGIDCGPGVELDTPFVKPQYLIHITETRTMYGPVEKDFYILFHEAPKDGILLTPDGSGGLFINKAEQAGGPFQTPREVCAHTREIPEEKIGFNINCL